MAPRIRRVTPAELVLLAVLVAWGALPIVLLAIHAAQTHTRLTGANGLVGADGELGGDQLQYLAWIRDSSSHGLAADLFRFTSIRRVYLEPLFVISAALFRLGLPLSVAYFVLTPIAIVALGAGAVAWARRFFGDWPGGRAATVALSVFLSAPASELLGITHSGTGGLGFPLYLLGSELHGADKVWGYAPSAIALGLMPIGLLATERALGARRRHRRGDGRALTVAAVSVLVASWLHPWQGVTVILIMVALAALRRGDGLMTLAAVAVAAGLPLLYYLALSHGDPAWSLASTYEATRRAPAITLIVGFGPLALIAAFGLSRPRGDVGEQIVLLWIVASLVNYFINDSFPPHAYQGLAFPFAVLAVRSFDRLRLPAVIGWAAVGLLTIPGMVLDARKFARTVSHPLVQYYLPRGDVEALAWVARSAPPGGVLAPIPFASVIPSQTGRAVWVGNGYWSRDYKQRKQAVNRLLRGHQRPPVAQAFAAGTGARILVADCAHQAPLRHSLGPLVQSVHTFGCARVFVLRAAGAH